MCGTATWEWAENRFAYEPIEHNCPGCYMEKSYADGRDLPPGTTVRLSKSNSAEVRKMRKRRERFSGD